MLKSFESYSVTAYSRPILRSTIEWCPLLWKLENIHAFIVPFLANIKCCPKFLEYALLVLNFKLFNFFFKLNVWNIWKNVFMKIMENLQVTQPNQSQLIKVIPVQSFRGVFTTQLKILPFVYWIAKESAIVDVQLGLEYPHLWSRRWGHQNNINQVVLVLL